MSDLIKSRILGSCTEMAKKECKFCYATAAWSCLLLLSNSRKKFLATTYHPYLPSLYEAIEDKEGLRAQGTMSFPQFIAINRTWFCGVIACVEELSGCLKAEACSMCVASRPKEEIKGHVGWLAYKCRKKCGKTTRVHKSCDRDDGKYLRLVN